ncbi:hypothetical protein JCM17478_18970 [Thermopirellula anaerolimosa]
MFYLAVGAAVLVLFAAVIGGVHLIGLYRWKAFTDRIHARMTAYDVGTTPAFPSDITRNRLPPPVQRYLNRVLGKQDRMILRLRMRQTGTFNMSESGEKWRPFSADQWVIVAGPAFDWNACIQAAPWVPVRVHDAYFGGEGMLSAAVFGVFRVVHVNDDDKVACGELLRFLAESPWYPTVLLPGGGVEWREIDDHAAEASLTHGKHTVRMTFAFNADDLVSEVRAESRDRLVSGRVEGSPWKGRFWDYREHHGITVPTAGEVAWVLPDGEHPYWRGRLEAVEFDFAP